MSAFESIAERRLLRSSRRAGASSVLVKEQLPNLALTVLLPVVATAFLWLTSGNYITPVQGLSAFLLLCLPWGAYRKWKREAQDEVPLLSMIGMIYWLYYAFPLFWGDRSAVARWAAGHEISNDAITGAMVMALLGMLSLCLGFRSHVGRRWVPQILPDLPSSEARWGYLRFIIIIGSLANLYDELPYLFGEEWRQVIYIFESIIPLVGFAILFRNYLRGEASRFDKFLMLIFLGIQFLVHMSSGWLGSLAYLMITCTAIYIAEKKRIPRIAVAVLVVYVLFFQVGKFSVRQKYWYDQEPGSKTERIAFWFNESFNKWEEALSESRGEMLRLRAFQTMSRVSLLTQTGNVLELTPSTVPYQHGRLYSYMAVSLIPRLVWPDKPSVNEANRFYQVAYGITAEKDLERGSFGVGVLTESYINFSWFGVILIMFLLGVFFDFFQKTFLAESSGPLLRGIGVVLLPYFLSIDGQLSVYMGGIVQRILLTLLVLLPVIRFRKTNNSATTTVI